jgi:hypothetical protein
MPRRKATSGNGAISKSQAVRDYLAHHPTAMPKEIKPALKAAHGIDVSSQMISTIKTKLRQGPKRHGRKRRTENVIAAGRRGRSSNGARFSIDDLVSAKKLAQQVGGVDRAQQLIQALARLA